MKSFVKKKRPKEVTNYQNQREGSVFDNSGGATEVDHLLLQRIGKSRQEILDLIKILKTF